MESKKINQLATNVAPQSTDLTIIGDPITGVSKKITWLQVSTLIGTAANLQQVTDNGATTTNPIAIGGLTITGLATGVLKSDSGVISSVPFGAANGVATLGGDGKVPSIQLPSYVDDVVEVANFAALPATGETGKIYITLDNNKVYRWTGSTYVEIAANNAVWGAITGTLSNQTDLQNALNAKQNTITLTTTGTSGASTLVGSTLNIPNYSTDLSGYVPYTGATTNVNLGTHSLSAKDLIINHTSGSGVAASITKGGSGEALTVVKSSGSGNAASITGGVTLLDELHLTTDLADAYIASAATWNAKQNAITLTTTGTSGAATLVGATLNIPNYADQFVGTVTSVGLSSATSGVTIGSTPITTSGTITLAIATASGSQNGLLSSTDWTTFNGKQAALNGTGFVKISGTTISYDNSTYLTTSSASSTYLPLAGGTLTGQLVINRASGNGLQVASDNVVITAATGFGSPRQLVFTCGNGPTTTLEAKGFGGNYITDFNIKTYNSSGTAFDVFFGTSAGDVGIGTDTPLSKLQVVATGTVLRLGEASGTTGKQLLFGVDATSGRGEIQAVWQGTSNTPLGLNVAGGNVLIGTTTDNGAKLNVNGNIIATQGNFFQTASSGFGITLRNRNANQQWGLTVDVNAVDDKYLGLYDITNSAYRMVVTNGGNVGIGTSSPANKLTISGTGDQHIGQTSTTAGNCYTIYTNTSKSYLAGLSADLSNSYIIYDATAASERMRITSGGELCVATSSVINAGGVTGVSNMLNPNNDGKWALALQNNASTNSYGRGLGIRNTTDFNNGDNEFLFLIGNTTPRLYVQSNGGVYNYSANNSNLSDVRTKKDIVPLESYWDKFKAIEIVKFKYKDQTHDDYNIGVIAQQVLEVAPEFVNEDGFGGKEYLPEDGIPLKSIYSEDLHNATIKVLQECMAKIEELEAKVYKLENK
jgi:hypothetical protein